MPLFRNPASAAALIASQAEAVAGINNSKAMSPLRSKQQMSTLVFKGTGSLVFLKTGPGEFDRIGISGGANSEITFGANALMTVPANMTLNFADLPTLRTTIETPRIVTKATTGDPAATEPTLVINTFDNTFKVWAEGAWRTLATW